jgi:hypothetical protein
MNAPPTSTDLATTQRAAQEDAETTEKVLALIKATPITTPELFVQAGEELKEIKGEIKRIESVRDEAVKPLQAVVAVIRGWFATPLARLAEAETIRKGGIAAYLRQREADERAALEAARIAALADDGAASAAALATITAAGPMPKVAGLSSVPVYKFEVTDASLLPREYLMPDEKTIGAKVRGAKGNIQIPGVRVWVEQSIRSTASGSK